MLRRLIVIASACAALLGLSAAFAGSAGADFIQIRTIDAGVARVCVGHRASNTGVCLHV